MNNIKKKHPREILFQERGGELIIWKFKGNKPNSDLMQSIFLKSEYVSSQGGHQWQLLTDGQTHIVNPNRMVIWDVKSDYEEEWKAGEEQRNKDMERLLKESRAKYDAMVAAKARAL